VHGFTTKGGHCEAADLHLESSNHWITHLMMSLRVADCDVMLRMKDIKSAAVNFFSCQVNMAKPKRREDP
jgi:hypothetical protein